MTVIIHPPRDPNTLSTYTNFHTTHTQASCTIDFNQQLVGTLVTLTLKSITEAATTEVILDTSRLEVLDVKINGKGAKFELLPELKPYGRGLKVLLGEPVANGEAVDVEIRCQTTRDCTAIQFMTPAQAKSSHPYMFTQCQATHARSIFPCQDTPDVKSTFGFNITSTLPVVASGLPTGTRDLDGGWKQYNFEQKIPIPSYLFAIASGDIKTADIGPRSVVATGPESLKASQWEFEESIERCKYFQFFFFAPKPYLFALASGSLRHGAGVQISSGLVPLRHQLRQSRYQSATSDFEIVTVIEKIEKIVYPYQWSTYNLLVLPPSFPYGGMENPVYTYCTPTVVSGDRENVGLIAHELSHSYSGNLVTNASWEHFWLNEGWTTYLERRLQAAIHGEPQRDFSAIIGWKALVDSVDQFGQDHDFTKLIPDLKGKDPDDAFSSIPYEKGYTFLSYLEAQVGKDKWNKYITHYFTTFARRSLDSYDFKANLLEYFSSDPMASAALKAVDWDDWFYTPGLPPKPDFDTSLVSVCYALASKWEKADCETFEPKADDIKGWKANQVVIFLEKLQALPKPLDKTLAQKMGRAYGLAKGQNVEVVARYFRLALMARDEEVLQPTAELLGKMGRMKFVRPL